MPSFLQIENISKSYGPKILFENIDFNINEGDKIALVAPNGSGKTSLMRILAGEDKSDSGGRILFLKDISIAFLKQDYDFDPEASIENQILQSASADIALRPEHYREEFLQRMREIATAFNLRDLTKKMSELSGGEIKRVALTQLLSLDAQFLILDEPTNHLDLAAVEYLESYLGRKRCTLLMVTHDRYFLDRVCNTVMELDHGAIYTYRGNYQNYLEKRSERIANYNAETDRVRNLLRRELEWIHATPCARSGKAKYRIEAFHALADRASQVYTTRQLNLEGVGEASRLGTKIIDCHHVCFEREGRDILSDFDYKFQRYEKVGIVGANGCGKTTFLNILTGSLAPTGGTVERGESLKIGYYRQQGIGFNDTDTVLDTVPDTRLLNRFMFPREMLSMPVGRLSGGERRRLYLLTVLMQNPNLLILDEPTNDLDIVTLNILEEYLLEFSGSLIVVSHDRHFMDRIADHLLVFTADGTIKDFIGSMSEIGPDILNPKEVSETSGKAKPVRKPVEKAKPARRKLSWKEQRELEDIETRLQTLEKEKTELEEAMSGGALDYSRLQEAGDRIQTIIAETDALEMRWLELSELT